jgi:hypothetical protein
LDTNPVSQRSLLRSLDSLEQICIKRIKNIELIDDEELPAFVASIKSALLSYSEQHHNLQLSLVSGKLPDSVKIKRISIPLIFACLCALCLIGFFLLSVYVVIIILPVFLVVLVPILLVKRRFADRNETTLTGILTTVNEVKMILSNS